MFAVKKREIKAEKRLVVVRADRSSSHSILRGRLGSGIDNRRVLRWQKNIQTRNFIE